LITKLMKTFNKIKKFSGYLDYNIEETVLNLSPKAHTKRMHQAPKTFCRDSKQFLKAL